MQEIYRFIDDAIEADRQRYTDIADQIWDHPETRFEEFWSAEHLASALESARRSQPVSVWWQKAIFSAYYLKKWAAIPCTDRGW